MNNFRLVPNQITAIRFALVPIMWGLAVNGLFPYIGIALAICLVSDALDGHLARRLGQATEFGAKFDSLADNILIPSALIWLLMCQTAIFLENPVLSVLAIGTYISSLTLGWIKYRQFGNLHLYLSKVSGLVQYIFIIITFITGHYSQWLFYLTLSIFFLSSLETLILQIISVKVDQHLGSILFVFNILDWRKIFPSEIKLQSKQSEVIAENKGIPAETLKTSMPVFSGYLFRLFRVIYGGELPLSEDRPLSSRLERRLYEQL